MSFWIALAFAFLYASRWGTLNADGKQLMLAVAILLAGGLAGIRD
jgi:hypothetical protein